MLVKTAVLNFTREADPNGESAGVQITASNLDTLNGEKFTKERRLDIYNDACRIVLDELLKKYGKQSDHVAGFLFPNADLSWVNNTTNSTATFPDGYLMVPSEESSLRVVNVPVRLRDNPGQLLAGNNPELFQDSNTLFAFERATDFIHYGSPPANSLISTSTQKIDYIGIIDHTLTDVATASTTEERFLDTDMPLVMQAALSLARNENNAAQAIAEVRNALK
jgi:hypothetical protein